MKYTICEAKTGDVLIQSIELPEDRVENLSSENAEGIFGSAALDELSGLGGQSVYAILL